MNEARLSFLSAAVFGLVAIFAVSFCEGFTNEQDVHAINILYAALGTPLLPGWVQSGGDPCLEAWQGVQCTESNITAITINGANLGGELGDALGNFTSITTIDLSNNNIGGTIPENLPLTLKTFFLSANQLTGSIPSSLSKLTLLSDMSVNVNHLSGDLLDAFQSLTGLINFSHQILNQLFSLSSELTRDVQLIYITRGNSQIFSRVTDSSQCEGYKRLSQAITRTEQANNKSSNMKEDLPGYEDLLDSR